MEVILMADLKEAQHSRTILLVEDQVIISLAEEMKLKAIGYNVLTAISGEKAVETVFSGTKVDLILMDIDLGTGIDGTEAARIILEKYDCPIVFLTAHSEKEMVDRVRGITRYGYIIKNSGDFVLQSSIEMAFQLFEMYKRHQNSEALMRTLVKNIPDLVWVKDTEGVYLSCNRRFEDFFGAREADIVGRTDFDFVEKDQADFFRVHDQIAMEADKPVVNEEWVTFRSDGSKVLLETKKTAIHDAEGALIGVLGIGRDITSRRKYEEALQSNEQRYQAALDNLPHVVVIYNKDRRIQFVNKAACRISGHDSDFYRDRMDSELWPDLYKSWDPYLSRTMEFGTVESTTVDFPGVDGMVELNVVYVPLLDDKGEVQEVMAITR